MHNEAGTASIKSEGRCIYALFIQNEERIKDCKKDFKLREGRVFLGGYLWALSPMGGEMRQIRCITETHIE